MAFFLVVSSCLFGSWRGYFKYSAQSQPKPKFDYFRDVNTISHMRTASRECLYSGDRALSVALASSGLLPNVAPRSSAAAGFNR